MKGTRCAGMHAAALLMGVSLMALGMASQAQEAGKSGAAPDASLDEVIVTAQKRSERLQDVPVSVSAFNEAAMENAMIESGTEIARLTPNLRASVLGDESQPKFDLRGISTSEFNLNSVSPTGVFYDEVYIGAQYLGGAQAFDLEQIEVLRGPQGTLYGKNTTAGAVNYISHRPDFQEEGDVTVGYGSYGYMQIKGAAEVPLVDDRLTVRAAFDVAHSDGYIQSVTPNIGNRSNIDNQAGRLTVAYRDDDDDFKATLRVFDTLSNPSNVGVINTGTLPGGLDAAGINPRINPYTGAQLNSRQMAPDMNGEIVERGTGGSLTMEKDVGIGTLTSITSYLQGRFVNQVDASGTNTHLLDIDFGARNFETSQDLRLTTNDWNGFKVIAGLYFYRDRSPIETGYTIFSGPPILPILDQSYDQVTTSYAAYVDGTYDLTEIFQLYGGLRFTDDRGSMIGFEVTPVIPTQPTLTYHDDRPTGRAGVRAKVDSDVMLFAQYARGYRSSAFNGGALTNVADLTVAAPEELDAYEAGIKSQWFGRRLTFNASAFYYNFRNQQFVNLVGVSDQELVNAGASHIKGLEFEAAAKVTDRFSLDGSLGLLDAKYAKLALDGINLAGRDEIEAPPFTINFGGDYHTPLSNGGVLKAHADATRTGPEYYDAFNSAYSKAEASWDVGARLAYVCPSGKYEVAAYGKNLTDNSQVTGIVLDATTQTRFATVPYPRRFGVELTASF